MLPTLNRKCPAVDLHNADLPKVISEESGVHCGRHENNSQVAVGPHHVPQHHKKEISLNQKNIKRLDSLFIDSECKLPKKRKPFTPLHDEFGTWDW